MLLTNFKQVKTDDTFVVLKDDNGQDWYDAQELFNNKKIKVVFDSNFNVINYSKDTSLLYPINCSVIEIEDTEENLTFLHNKSSLIVISESEFFFAEKPSDFHSYSIDEKKWIEDIEAKENMQQKLNIAFLSSETRRTNDAIEVLNDAIEFEEATTEEVAQQKSLRKYRLDLSRVPNQETWPLNPTWPTCPEFFKHKE